jgi:hypothetical protein
MKHSDEVICTVMTGLLRGVPISWLSRRHNVSEKTIRRWRNECVESLRIDLSKGNNLRSFQSKIPKKADSKVHETSVIVVLVKH